MEIKNINKIILYSFFLIYLMIGLITLEDYGVNIEEHTQIYSGYYWLNYIFNFFEIEFLKSDLTLILSKISGDSNLPNPSKFTYGPVFDVPTAFLDLLLGNKDNYSQFLLRHTLVFIIFYLSAIVFFKTLQKRFNNFFIAFFGTLLFIFSPRIYGDSFHNNKDIIFLSLTVFSIYFAFKIFDKKKIKHLFLFSFFAALATSTRIMGLFLPISIILFLYLQTLNSMYGKNHKFNFLIIIFYSISLTIHWPYLWEDPVSNFFEFLSNSKNWIYSYYILFNGKYFLTTNLPDSFIFTWIGISSPIFNIILFLCGFFYMTRRLFNRFIHIEKNKIYNCDFWRSKNEMRDNFIIFNFISILSILIFLNVSLVSGWRHLYFLNFFITYIAVYFLQLILIKSKNYKKIFFVTCFILFIPNIYKIILFHPYQSLYLNELVNLKNKNNYLIDRDGLTRLDSIKKILSMSNKEKNINIANASFVPYYRIKDALNESDQNRVSFIGGDYKKADYIYNNFVYEIDPKFNDKYQIPSNFKKIYELKINGIKLYEIWKKN
tara:strand:+ start:4114 stop:5751 length:1638 start_codon:yes stop_codon:yes gene_type:complete